MGVCGRLRVSHGYIVGGGWWERMVVGVGVWTCGRVGSVVRQQQEEAGPGCGSAWF